VGSLRPVYVLSFLLVVEMNICVGRDVGHNWQRGHV
jgi:hypothetical protein